MTDAGNEPGLIVQRIEEGPVEDGAALVRLHTGAGAIVCRFHAAPPGDTAILWVFGAGGGLGGPAGGVYTRLARQLSDDGIASLELAYRRPADLANCVLDVQTGLAYLAGRGRSRVVLVGHSFGGAVVITVGAASAAVIAVAALSSVARGTEGAARLAPRPLLALHGEADEVIPAEAGRDIYRRASEPKRLILYPGCLHGLDQCREELDRDLLAWLRQVTGAGMRT